MSSKPKKSVISAKPVRKVAGKVAGKVAANATKKTGAALSVVAKRLHADTRVVKHARGTLKGLPGRTKKFLKSNPVRVLLGASAIGIVLAKLKHLV